MMQIKNKPILYCLGSGEAFDATFGNTSALLQLNPKALILFDCGYQIAERLFKLHLQSKINLNYIQFISITHLHADHCFGLVPLLGFLRDSKRTNPLTIITPRGGEKHLTRLIRLGYPNLLKRIQFPIHWAVAKEENALEFQLQSIQLKFSFLPTIHSIQNFSIRLDITATQKKHSSLHTSFAISGDGVLTEKHSIFYRGLNLLFQEAYKFKEDHPVHPNLLSVLEILNNTGIQKVCITHCSKSDRDVIAKKIKGIPKYSMALPSKVYLLKKYE